MASRAISLGSVTSTWVRTYWMPLPAWIRTALFTLSLTSCFESFSLRRLQVSIPSNRVPERFHFGSPAVRQVSRCIWDSIKGGSASLPPISTASSPSSGLKSLAISVKTPSLMRISLFSSLFSIYTFFINIYITPL